MITLTNGLPQGPNGIIVPNGSVSFQLNVDATVIAAPYGFVCAAIPVIFQFDGTGALIQPAQLWSNLELNPQNSVGLGTYYLVTFYDQNGAVLNAVPLWFQFTEAANATVDISKMTPFATIGGNVIFYPTIAGIGAVPPPTPTTLGGVFSNAGITGKFISAINTDGTVSIAGAAGVDTDVQFNDGGAFGGDSQFTWNKTFHTAFIGTTQPVPVNLGSLTPSENGLLIEENCASVKFAFQTYGYNATGAAYGGIATASTLGNNIAIGFQPSAVVNPILAVTVTGNSEDPNPLACANYAANVGAGTVQFMAACYTFVEQYSAGTTTWGVGFDAYNNQNSGGGTLTNSVGYYAAAQTMGTNNYGLYAEDFGLGATTFAVYIKGGNSYFGGPVNIVPPVLGASTYAVQIDGSALTQTSDTLLQINSPATIHNIITLVAGGGQTVMQLNPNQFAINVTNGQGIFAIGNTALEFDTTVAGGHIVFKNSSTTSWAYNLDNADVLIGGLHTSSVLTSQASEEITLSLAGVTTDSTGFLLPANAIIDCVAARITQAISGGSNPTTWEVGDTAPSLARFISPTAVATVTAVGLNHMQGSVSTDALGPVQTSAARVRITLDQIPGQGKVRVTVFYRVFTAAAS